MESAGEPKPSQKAANTAANWLEDWENEHKKHTNAKNYFLIDYQNLEESPWMRDRIIVADESIRKYFIKTH